MANDDQQSAFAVGPAAYRTGPIAYGGPKRGAAVAVDPEIVVRPPPLTTLDVPDAGTANNLLFGTPPPPTQTDL